MQNNWVQQSAIVIQMETVIKQTEDSMTRKLSNASRLHEDYRPLKAEVDLLRRQYLGLDRLPDLHEEEGSPITPEWVPQRAVAGGTCRPVVTPPFGCSRFPPSSAPLRAVPAFLAPAPPRKPPPPPPAFRSALDQDFLTVSLRFDYVSLCFCFSSFPPAFRLFSAVLIPLYLPVPLVFECVILTFRFITELGRMSVEVASGPWLTAAVAVCVPGSSLRRWSRACRATSRSTATRPSARCARPKAAAATRRSRRRSSSPATAPHDQSHPSLVIYCSRRTHLCKCDFGLLIEFYLYSKTKSYR